MAQPSEAQLEILNLLWNESPLTVREVHARLSEQRPVSYTTMLTQMQRMAEAGLLSRDTSKRTHRYRPAVARESVERNLFDKLADTVFGGSRVNLALRALGNSEPSAEELKALQRFIDQHK